MGAIADKQPGGYHGGMNSSPPIENRANLPAAPFAQLAQALASHRSIKHALDWLTAHTPPLTLSDMVTQDEFSHDILVEYPGGLYLAYDIS